MLVDLVDHALSADPDEPLGTVFHHIWTFRNDSSFVPHVLPLPTDAIPGTLEKIAVLKARLEAGVMLNHPKDRSMNPNSSAFPRKQTLTLVNSQRRTNVGPQSQAE